LRYYILVLAFIGIIVSFNKTVLIASTLYLLFDFFKDYTSKYFKLWFISIFFLVSILLIFFILQENPFIDIILTGRIPIYNAYLNFINENFLLGNNFMAIRMESGNGKIIHAHNSFFQLLADNGIVYVSIFLYYIYTKLVRSNYSIILVLFICCLTQHYIFWGVSHGDVLFFLILFNAIKGNEQKRMDFINSPALFRKLRI